MYITMYIHVYTPMYIYIIIDKYNVHSYVHVHYIYKCNTQTYVHVHNYVHVMYMHVHVCTCMCYICRLQVHCIYIYIHYDEFLSQKGFILYTALHRNFIAWYFKSILLENGISRYNLLLGDNVSHTYQQNLHRIQCVEAVQELDYVSPHQAKVRNSSLFCLYTCISEPGT